MGGALTAADNTDGSDGGKGKQNGWNRITPRYTNPSMFYVQILVTSVLHFFRSRRWWRQQGWKGIQVRWNSSRPRHGLSLLLVWPAFSKKRNIAVFCGAAPKLIVFCHKIAINLIPCLDVKPLGEFSPNLTKVKENHRSDVVLSEKNARTCVKLYLQSGQTIDLFLSQLFQLVPHATTHTQHI